MCVYMPRCQVEILPVQFGMPSMSRGFIGESKTEVKQGNLIKSRVGNCLPPPDQGGFHENWERNAATLVEKLLGMVKSSVTPAGGKKRDVDVVERAVSCARSVALRAPQLCIHGDP